MRTAIEILITLGVAATVFTIVAAAGALIFIPEYRPAGTPTE